jgi:ABC-type transport system involved in multi-copper enzyme maturation permease subunit
MRESGGTYTVTGTGKIGPNQPDDDMVETALVGVIAGLIALIAVGVLFATSEYRRGMIRTTFAATPRRGRVLAAKAIVLGVTSFGLGLIGVVVSFLVAIPVLRRNGFVAPAFPEPTLTDASVLRAVLLTAAFMAGVALVGLGVGVLLRHSAAAITITIVLVLLPLIVGMILPDSSPKWLMYTTLAGGLATERAKPPTVTLAEPWALIGPWAGISVVAAWAVVALGLAWWRLRQRDA